jgi:hypothetical protein
MISKIFKNLAITPIGVIGDATKKTLEFSRDAISNTLHWSGESLDFFSQYLTFWEEGRLNLENTSKDLKLKSQQSKEKIQEAIHNSVEGFASTLESLKHWEKTTDQMVAQNRVISSILGSTMDDRVRFTTIHMNWRLNSEDASTEELVQDFKASGKKEITIYVPGLFTDESLWKNQRIKINNRMYLSRGLSDYIEQWGSYSAYVRFNHGLHISENGRLLLELLRELRSQLPNVKLHFLSYSIGCLITRSMMFQAKESSEGSLKGLGKIVNIASPDMGSYLEKLGFWVGFLMEKTPITAVKVIGIIGNFRSDAIKDLSHGIIRKQDWAIHSPFFRGGKEFYFNELDGEDFYQAYAVFALPNDPHLSWLGDGIVETKSLRYLSNKLTHLLPNPEKRILEVHGVNHFTLLNSGKLFKWLKSIFVSNEI